MSRRRVNWMSREEKEREEAGGEESLRCLKDGESWPG